MTTDNLRLALAIVDATLDNAVDLDAGKTCAEHPCTCTPDREVGSPDADQ